MRYREMIAGEDIHFGSPVVIGTDGKAYSTTCPECGGGPHRMDRRDDHRGLPCEGSWHRHVAALRGGEVARGE